MSGEKMVSGKSDPLDSVFVRDALGTQRKLSDVLAEEGAENIEMDVSLLQKGDTVHVSFMGDGTLQRFSFKLVDAEWGDLDLSHGFSPSKSWIVEVYGLNPASTAAERVRLVGSGWGGSMVSPGVIATQRSLSFSTPDGERINSPFVSRLAVIREDPEGSGRPQRIVDPNDLAEENQHIRVIHESRMRQYEDLMKRFQFSDKFDFRDGAPYSGDDFYLQYEDEKVAAQYSQGAATGNTLVAYDKQTGFYASYKYFNFKGDDSLQVSYAKLDPEQYDIHGYGTLLELGSHTVHSVGADIIAHTTSPRRDLDAMNYKTVVSGAEAVLDLKQWNVRDIPLNVQLFSDNSVHVVGSYPYADLDAHFQNISGHISSKISIERFDGHIAVSFGTEKREILTPEEIYTRISKV